MSESSIVDEWFIVHKPSQGVDDNWHVTNKADTCVAHCFGFGHSIQGGEMLARRIAAALNAYRGLPTKDLEKISNVEVEPHLAAGKDLG